MKNKFKSLKVGDIVVMYEPYSRRFDPREEVITKIGNKYIFIDTMYSRKFNKETGYGEYGYNIFPGNLEEYNDYIETKKMCHEVVKLLEHESKLLTKEKLEQIIKIINNE